MRLLQKRRPPSLHPREAGSVSVPPREQLLRAMAEAAATWRAPRFFQRLPKVVRAGRARLLLGCRSGAEAGLSSGSGVSGEGTGGELRRSSLARAGLLSFELLAVCGEPSGHREGPVVVTGEEPRRSDLSQPFNLDAQEETETHDRCSCSASTVYSSLPTLGWVDLSWLGQF